MLFNSWQYIAFLVAVVILYFSLHPRWRVTLILVSSYIFYMSWRWEFGFLMLAVSAANFYVGKRIAYGSDRQKRMAWLVLSALVSLLPLAYFKYANFVLASMFQISQSLGSSATPPALNVILPVGISFFTFQAFSYSIDVYRHRTTVEHSLPRFLAFVAFFPQLVAGPIERSTNLLQQFNEVHHFDSRRAVEGAKLFIWGLFKKIVIADRLALYVNPVYDNPEAHSGPTLVVATLFFAFQIYCDFSGYSDMAIGSARIMGFRLMQNFNLPYLANSISNFWKRWHISLSSWFSDYVYIPLGGNRVPVRRWMINIFVVFVVSGLWHGANWTFVVWGALHGLYYLMEYAGTRILNSIRMTQIIEKSWYKGLRIIVTFMLVAFAWIFFRANDIADALFISHKIFDWTGQLWWGASSVTSLLSILLITILMVVQVLQYHGKVSIYFSETSIPRVISWTAYAAMLLAISLLGMSSNAFIYFQF